MNSVGSGIAQAKGGTSLLAAATTPALIGAGRRRMFCLLVVALAHLGPWSHLASAAPRAADNPNRVQTLTIIVRPEGLMPRVVKLKAGAYSIGVFNRSGVDELRFELDRLPGRTLDAPATERVASGVAPERTARWFQRFIATRGYYRLRVADRPSWACLIEVE